MRHPDQDGKEEKMKTFYHAKGITYFNKKTERVFFFVLTLLMLLWGLLAKFGILTNG